MKFKRYDISKIKKDAFRKYVLHTKQAHKFSCFQGTLTQGVISSEEMGEPYVGKETEASIGKL